MEWYRRAGDRRGRLRFELIGQVWGTLAVTESVPVRNLGRGGALIEAPVQFRTGSAQRLRLVLGTHVTDVQVRVRHVTASSSPEGPRYLVGVEFIDLPSSTLNVIDQLVAAGGANGGGQLDA